MIPGMPFRPAKPARGVPDILDPPCQDVPSMPQPLPLPPAQVAALEAAYATPPRAYHNFAHVRGSAAPLRGRRRGPGWKQPMEVRLAVLYHDAIYEAGRKDNEARSAELAVAHIAQWLPDAGRRCGARGRTDPPHRAPRRRLIAGDVDRDAAHVPRLRHGHPRLPTPATFDGLRSRHRCGVSRPRSGVAVQAQPPPLPQGAAGAANASSSATGSTSASTRRRASTCGAR